MLLLYSYLRFGNLAVRPFVSFHRQSRSRDLNTQKWIRFVPEIGVTVRCKFSLTLSKERRRSKAASIWSFWVSMCVLRWDGRSTSLPYKPSKLSLFKKCFSFCRKARRIFRQNAQSMVWILVSMLAEKQKQSTFLRTQKEKNSWTYRNHAVPVKYLTY